MGIIIGVLSTIVAIWLVVSIVAGIALADYITGVK